MIASPDDNEEVYRLFHEQVPELASGIVEIKAVARERGCRCMVAVYSADERIDPVGACAGEQGIRLKPIVRQLSGEHIDIIRWSDSPQTFIKNTLAPLIIRSIDLDAACSCATVRVLAQADRHAVDPVRLRLTSRLTGWELRLIET